MRAGGRDQPLVGSVRVHRVDGVAAPVAGARLRDKRNGFSIPPQLSIKTIANAIPRPWWWFDFLTTPKLEFASLSTVQTTSASYPTFPSITTPGTYPYLEARFFAGAAGSAYPSARALSGVATTSGVPTPCNGSPFFICHADLRGRLPKNYTVFGQVTRGLDVVDVIAAAPTGAQDRPLEPVAMTSIRIVDEAVTKGIHMTSDRGQRRSQLVRDRHQEVPLALLRFREPHRHLVEPLGEMADRGRGDDETYEVPHRCAGALLPTTNSA